MKLKLNDISNYKKYYRVDYILLKPNDFKNKRLLNELYSKNIKIGIEIDNFDKIKYYLDKYADINFFQTKDREVIDESNAKRVKAKDIELFYLRELDCDEDAIWTLPIDFNNNLLDSEIIDYLNFYNANIEIELFPTLDFTKIKSNKIDYLIDECGKYKDELSINEINNFAKDIALFLNIDNLEKDMKILNNKIANIKGISF